MAYGFITMRSVPLAPDVKFRVNRFVTCANGITVYRGAGFRAMVGFCENRDTKYGTLTAYGS